MFKYVTHLTHLNLSNNQLSSLDANVFSDLDELKALNLSYNKLRGYLDEDLFLQTNKLEKLIISKNEIEFLNIERLFRNTNNLLLVDISNNKLDNRSLNERAVNNSYALKYKLDDLEASSNRLTDFNFIRNFFFIKTLNLSSNQVEDIEENLFDSMFSLQQVYLSGNLIYFILQSYLDRHSII